MDLLSFDCYKKSVSTIVESKLDSYHQVVRFGIGGGWVRLCKAMALATTDGYIITSSLMSSR
jgi:hypothetical protein